MKHLILSPNCDYDKLYFFLKDSKFSESLISSLRHDDNALKINGEKANMRSKICTGQKLEITLEDKKSSSIPFNDLPLDILFEDEDLLVINKAAGVATIPSKRHYSDNLAGAVSKYMAGKQPHFVFRALGRLDKDTSGIVVIAKNQYAANMVEIKKTYQALCVGNFTEKEFNISAPIQTVCENGINQQQRKTSLLGKAATTHVEVVKNFNGYALVRLILSQGRTHQIRVHLSSISHPLIGDQVYGNEKSLAFLDKANRTLLHCEEATISFLDASKADIHIHAAKPNDFASWLK